MAKTIIKGGKNEFVGHCKWCGCDFRYTAQDTYTDGNSCWVDCPHCNRKLDHFGEHGTNSAGPSSLAQWQNAQAWGQKG